MKAKGLFFTLIAELLQKFHSDYYKTGGKNRFTAYLCSKVDL